MHGTCFLHGQPVRLRGPECGNRCSGWKLGKENEGENVTHQEVCYHVKKKHASEEKEM